MEINEISGIPGHTHRLLLETFPVLMFVTLFCKYNIITVAIFVQILFNM
jgi:hypothetical protein